MSFTLITFLLIYTFSQISLNQLKTFCNQVARKTLILESMAVKIIIIDTFAKIISHFSIFLNNKNSILIFLVSIASKNFKIQTFFLNFGNNFVDLLYLIINKIDKFERSYPRTQMHKIKKKSQIQWWTKSRCVIKTTLK